MLDPKTQQIVQVFHAVFSADYRTRIVLGGAEPEYLQADTACTWHRIVAALANGPQ